MTSYLILNDRCLSPSGRPTQAPVGCVLLWPTLDLLVKCQSGIDLFGVIRAIKHYMFIFPACVSVAVSGGRSRAWRTRGKPSDNPFLPE